MSDVLTDTAPALSATSDLPVIDPANSLDESSSSNDSPDTAQPEQPAGEETGSEKPGEATDAKPEEDKSGDAPKPEDETPPKEKAWMARERNKRQAAEQQAAELRQQLSQALETLNKVTQPKPSDDPRPSRDTFSDPDAYDKALIDWSARRAAEAAKAEVEGKRAQEEQAKANEALMTSYKARQEAFEADHPDYDELVMSDDLPITPAMGHAILTAEDGPAIAYHLGQHPDEAARIAKLPPVQQAFEIGRISLRLQPAQPAVKPAPIKPLGSRSNAASKSPEEMSMEEYAAMRNSPKRAN